MRLTRAQARALWGAAQGLGARDGGELPGLVARTRWLPTLGGAEAYLALSCRSSRLVLVADLDRARRGRRGTWRPARSRCGR